MDSRLARWIALLVFAILIVGWVLAAVYLTGASARRPGFPYKLSSKLAANYTADGGEKISSLRISIVADSLRDLGIPIEQQVSSMGWTPRFLRRRPGTFRVIRRWRSSSPPIHTRGPTATPAPFEVGLWSIAEDIDGNRSFIMLGTYTLPGACS